MKQTLALTLPLVYGKCVEKEFPVLICKKCNNEATMDHPDILCDYHWAYWFWIEDAPYITDDNWHALQDCLDQMECRYGTVQRRPT